MKRYLRIKKTKMKNQLKFILLIFSAVVMGQEKSKIIFSNEVVTIKKDKELSIEKYVEEERKIGQSKNIKDYSVWIPYDNFREITDIKGATYDNERKKKSKLNGSYVGSFDAKQENIFHSDAKVKYFEMPNVEDGDIVDYSYIIKQKNPRLLSGFYFQNELKTQSAKIEIKVGAGINIGYTIYGNDKEKISFSQRKEEDFDVYSWEMKDSPAFEEEAGMPNSSYHVPHLIYYIKDYELDGKKETLLGSTDLLYKWYYSLVKDINKTNQNDLKTKTLELIKGQKTDTEKAKAIFQWVQQNVHYVAFEYGMGGFIPRDAGETYQKLYGDCKDMANLLNEMLHYANLNSSLTWIGTRDKPYTYSEVPTPVVDNHMIASVVLDGKRIYLDATDKFCPFTYPSSMIQGKEALIGKSETEFIVEKVPLVLPKSNQILIKSQLQMEEDNLTGTVDADFIGYKKSDLLHTLSALNQKEVEVWKNMVVATNPKINLDILENQKNEYLEKPAKAKYTLKLEHASKKVGDKILLKALLFQPLAEATIDIENRKQSIEKEYLFEHEFDYQISLPKEYKIDFLPESSKEDYTLGGFEISYKVVNNSLQIKQKVYTKGLMIAPKDFENWNNFIKKLNKQYNQSIIFIK